MLLEVEKIGIKRDKEEACVCWIEDYGWFECCWGDADVVWYILIYLGLYHSQFRGAINTVFCGVGSLDF